MKTRNRKPTATKTRKPTVPATAMSRTAYSALALAASLVACGMTPARATEAALDWKAKADVANAHRRPFTHTRPARAA